MERLPYNPGQFDAVLPFVQYEPDWMVLGGPADGDEAQCAAARWPAVRVLGLEPVTAHREWQEANGWPSNSILLPYALWCELGVVGFSIPDGDENGPRRAHVNPSKDSDLLVPAVTLDRLDAQFGSFRNAILWLDIEGSELQALRGGIDSLRRQVYQLVNLELAARDPKRGAEINALLISHGYRAVHDWSYGLCRDAVQANAYLDRIYVRGEK